MGASDFLSGGGPRFGSRVLSDAAQTRRSGAPDLAGRRPQVLQRSHGPTQLSLFSQLEPRSNPVDAPEADLASRDDPPAGETPEGSTRTGD